MAKLSHIDLNHLSELIAVHGSIPRVAEALGVSSQALYKHRQRLGGAPPAQEPYRTMSVRLPVETADRVIARAKDDGTSKSRVLADAVEAYL